ncbi:MAG TPA: transcriptional regulator NrdR, partial [Verrucomicrobiae bacterium]|nr:transcriptional regulator NrdR [Verrucomicrobiae bacterium]
RRRECTGCSHRFTTYEEVEHEGLMVLKRDGRREEFSREKLLAGLKKACQKRPVSLKTMDDLVDHIVAVVTEKFESEVPGEFIGKLVMDGLREMDEVAYVRFASVYRRFQEATDFVQEVKKLEAAK